MKKNIFIFSAFILLITACNNNPKNPQIIENDENIVVVDKTHNAATSLDYYGTYSGTLPTASGEGIETTLTLKRDNSYVLESVYLGKDNQIFEEKGKYTLEGNILTLQSDPADDQYYHVGEGYVLKLDNDKQIITGNLANEYRLNKED